MDAILPATVRRASEHCSSRILWHATRECQHLSAALVTGKRLQNKASAHFDQRHHDPLQREAFRFKFIRCNGRSDTMRRIDQDTHFGKRLGHDEPVPTSKAPATRKFQIHRQHCRARFLCKKNNSRAKFVSRTTRTIRSDHHVATGREHLSKLTNSARPQPRA